MLTRENQNVDTGLKSKPGMPGISGDAASPGICHIPFILRTMNELLQIWLQLSIIRKLWICWYQIDHPGAAARVAPRIVRRKKMRIPALTILVDQSILWNKWKEYVERYLLLWAHRTTCMPQSTTVEPGKLQVKKVWAQNIFICFLIELYHSKKIRILIKMFCPLSSKAIFRFFRWIGQFLKKDCFDQKIS